MMRARGYLEFVAGATNNQSRTRWNTALELLHRSTFDGLEVASVNTDAVFAGCTLQPDFNDGVVQVGNGVLRSGTIIVELDGAARRDPSTGTYVIVGRWELHALAQFRIQAIVRDSDHVERVRLGE